MSDTTPNEEVEIEVDLGGGTIFRDVIPAPTGKVFSELGVVYEPTSQSTERDNDE